DVDGHTREVVAAAIDIARVDADPDLEPDVGDRGDEVKGAADRLPGGRKHGHDRVPLELHHSPAPASDARARQGVVAIEQTGPARVAHRRRLLRGTDDVTEE